MSTILVVDDDVGPYREIESGLSSSDHRLLHASEQSAVLSIIAEAHVDLVLFGADPTNYDSLNLLREIRLLFPGVRTILMSDRGTPAAAIAALHGKVCDLLVKPFTVAELVAAIEGALGLCLIPEIEVISAQPHWVELRVPCDLNAVPLLQKLLVQLEADLPEETRDAVSYAFREMLNNAIEHGGNLNPASFVEVASIRLKRAIIFRIKDPGPGFDPGQLPHAAVSNPDYDPFRHVTIRNEKGLRAGGFGILLTNQLVDELVYNERRNELIFVKYLD